MTEGDSSQWDDFFQQNLVPSVLAYVIETWEQMPKPNASDLEDAISIQLYSALIRGKNRNQHAFLIRYEDVEVDTDLAKETGRKDIVFYPSNQEEIYFCLEAKRLNATISGKRRSLANEYVKEGMLRFVTGKYARSVRHGAMLAYVLDGQTSQAISTLEKNIRNHLTELCMKTSGFLSSRFRPNDPLCKETHHQRTDETAHFSIHHLFLSAGANNRLAS